MLRRILPRPLYMTVRTVVMALFTPVVYAARYGYFRSALSRSVTDAHGASAPWMTFPLVTFLETLSFTGRSVLEFGSGSSSVWWGERADRVLALETEPAWLARVQAAAPANVDVVLGKFADTTQADFDAEVGRVVATARFDVVVVDGGDRVKALRLAPTLVAADGVIIVDDIDLFDSEPEWIAALADWRAAGYGRIDFYGLAIAAPFTRRRRCTSIFFRPGSFVTDPASRR